MFRRVGSATAIASMGVMPVFLVSASSVLIRSEMGISEAAIGAAIAVAFAATALTSTAGGKLSDRLGAKRALIIATAGSSTSLVGISLGSGSLGGLLAWVALGGAVNGLAQPATNLLLARSRSVNKGLLFGIKQAGPPSAALFAGILVPLVGAPLGWRWPFALMAVLAWFCVPLIPRSEGSGERQPNDGELDSPLGYLVVLACAASVGMGAATAVATFLVEGSVARGLSVASAGWLLSAASLCGIAVRIGAGWIADRRDHSHLQVTSAMLALGGVGLFWLALGPPGSIAPATIMALSFSWGWSGLLMFAVVDYNRNAPAAATGVVQAGAALGAMIGPLILGLVISSGISYQSAWLGSAVAAMLASLLVAVSRALLMRRFE